MQEPVIETLFGGQSCSVCRALGDSGASVPILASAELADTQ